MNKSKANKDEVNIMLAELSEDIVNLMLREHQSIHLELEHVGHLISDASKSLTTSFDELNKITIEQNKIFSLASRPDNKDNDNVTASSIGALLLMYVFDDEMDKQKNYLMEVIKIIQDSGCE